tara:strand:- start:10330 stop:11277 length:948 start_codon:yes stop_codon:yes gene_type:complete
MLRQAASRLRTLTPAPQRLFSATVDAAKAHTSHWEPALRLADASPDTSHEEAGPDSDDNVLTLTTYAAFDPGMTRPLLFSGYPPDAPLSRISPHQDWVLMTTFSAFDPGMTRPLDAIVSSTQPPQRKSEMPANAVVKQEEKALVQPTKPCPYMLPTFLQPRSGTTYAMMHGSAASVQEPGRVGVLQAVLYGVPEPGEVRLTQAVGKEGGVLHAVLYGVKDEVVTVDVKIGEVEIVATAGKEDAVAAVGGEEVAVANMIHVKKANTVEKIVLLALSFLSSRLQDVDWYGMICGLAGCLGSALRTKPRISQKKVAEQ